MVLGCDSRVLHYWITNLLSRTPSNKCKLFIASEYGHDSASESECLEVGKFSRPNSMLRLIHGSQIQQSAYEIIGESNAILIIICLTVDKHVRNS